MEWNVYLSGEIHTDWREQIIAGAEDLPVNFASAVTDHAASDAAGAAASQARNAAAKTTVEHNVNM